MTATRSPATTRPTARTGREWAPSRWSACRPPSRPGSSLPHRSKRRTPPASAAAAKPAARGQAHAYRLARQAGRHDQGQRPPPAQHREPGPWRQRVVAVDLGLLYAFPLVTSVVSNQHWQRHLEQIGPMTAGLYIQATANLSSLPLTPWLGPRRARSVSHRSTHHRRSDLPLPRRLSLLFALLPCGLSSRLSSLDCLAHVFRSPRRPAAASSLTDYRATKTAGVTFLLGENLVEVP